uniref:Uncharacterized protein n=1 Tax=Rhizophora mucronata TaxID=61149 RepID=A0A2P2QE19_RHIMU
MVVGRQRYGETNFRCFLSIIHNYIPIFNEQISTNLTDPSISINSCINIYFYPYKNIKAKLCVLRAN